MDTHKAETTFTLILFSDNAYSQNKNRFVFTFLNTLVQKGIFTTIILYVPMQTESDFGFTENKIKNNEKIYKV